METAPQTSALTANAQELPMLTSPQLALNTQAGLNHAANASFSTRVVEIPTLNSTTQMAQMMLVSGKSTAWTGLLATVADHPALLQRTSHAPRKYSPGEVTPGNYGQPAQPADAAVKKLKTSLRNNPQPSLTHSSNERIINFQELSGLIGSYIIIEWDALWFLCSLTTFLSAKKWDLYRIPTRIW